MEAEDQGEERKSGLVPNTSGKYCSCVSVTINSKLKLLYYSNSESNENYPLEHNYSDSLPYCLVPKCDDTFRRNTRQGEAEEAVRYVHAP